MKTIKLPLTLLFLFFATVVFAQKATVRGVILDENNLPLGGVNVIYNDAGTISDLNGFYLLEIPSNEDVTVSGIYGESGGASYIINNNANDIYVIVPLKKHVKINIDEFFVAFFLYIISLNNINVISSFR